MQVSRIRALRGPNLGSRHSPIEAVLPCTDGGRSLASLPGFEARLRALFPDVGGMSPASHEETLSTAHALEFCALGLQEQAGCPVTFSRTTQTVEPGVYQVVVEYSEEDVCRLAVELAQALCQAADDDAFFELTAALARLRELD